MALIDDLDEVEELVAGHTGFENDQTGRILIRLLRAAKIQRQINVNLRARIEALETRIPPGG